MGRLRTDDGQMMASFVVLLCLSILALFTIALVPIGAATNEKTRSQTAADAAALAGAEAIRDEWLSSLTSPGELTYLDPTRIPETPAEDDDDDGDDDGDPETAPPPAPPSDPGQFIGASTGQSAAQQYALRNGAQVVAYQVDPSRGQVYAAVENTQTAYEEYGRARSEATARVDLDLSACNWVPGAPPPEQAEGGPAVFTARLTCGDFSADYLVDNSSPERPTIDYVGTSEAELYGDLEPRLIE